MKPTLTKRSSRSPNRCPRSAFVADTSAIVRKLRGDRSVESFFLEKRFAISFATLAELSTGVLKARDPAAASARLTGALEDVEVIVGSATTPLIYAQVHFHLAQRGLLIPINDIWIAAVAIEAHLPLLARDAHFDRVTGLQVINC